MRYISLRALLVSALAIAVGSPTALGDEAFSLVVNPFTGAASLRNDALEAVELDGYLLRSSTPLFSPTGWVSLATQPGSGWDETAAFGNRLGETNLFGSLLVAAGESVSIGQPYAPIAPTQIGQLAAPFNFTYSLVGQGSATGDVEFEAQNSIVLVVDPTNGSSRLVNQSPFEIEIDGYLVTAASGTLDTTGWTALENSLGAPGGWQASAGTATRVAEGNLFGSSTMPANGSSLPLGQLINEALLLDETDLQVRVSVAGLGTVQGSVLFQLTGDFNGDGRVNAADYTVWRDNLGTRFTVSDYSLWKSNFGATIGVAPSAVGSLQASAVPEPGTLLMVALLLTTTAVVSRR